MKILTSGVVTPHRNFAGVASQAQAQQPPTFTDSFTSTFGQQAGVGLGFTAGAGAVAGAVVSSLLPSALPHMGMAAGLGAAAGLGFGLLALSAYSAITALTVAPPPEAPTAPSAPGPAPVPAPPASAPPAPHPDLAVDRELEQTSGILRKRGSLLNAYLDDLRTYKDTAGRRGLDSSQSNKKLLHQAEQEWVQQQKNRSETRKLEEAQVREASARRLQELLGQRQSLGGTQQKADILVRETIGRIGREAVSSAERLGRDLDAEIARLKTSLGV